jgi:CRP-like cAMP-binding protein
MRMLRNPSDRGLLLVGNTLLGSLEHSDLHLLLPHLWRVSAGHRDILFDVGDEIDLVYFPETAMIALIEHDHGERSIETGIVGREGFIGWQALMGSAVATCRADVQLDGGMLLAIKAPVLAVACQASPRLLRTLLRFTEAVMVQMGCTSLANSSYSLAERLSRWLVMRHDRVSHDVLCVHHDEISMCLGVRRASVTDCLHVLEGELLIKSRRGKITILDRDGLLAKAGKSYGLSEEHNRSLSKADGLTSGNRQPGSVRRDSLEHTQMTAEPFALASL